ncbi:unnamed protein product, partial [Prorocentrum cordatum]
DLEEANRRRQQLKESISEMAKTLFEPVIEKAGAVRAEHAACLARLQPKRRRGNDGEATSTAAPAVGASGAAAGSSPVPSPDGDANDSGSSRAPRGVSQGLSQPAAQRARQEVGRIAAMVDRRAAESLAGEPSDR